MSSAEPFGMQYTECLLDLLGSIQNARLSLHKWDAAGFERAVTEQQRICDLLQQMKPSSGGREGSALAAKVRATLRGYQLVIERGTNWCRILTCILGEPASRKHSVNLRPEL